MSVAIALLLAARYARGVRVARPLRKAPGGSLDRLQSQQRALGARRADRNAEVLEDMLSVDRLHLIEALALDLLGEDRRRRLRDRAAASLEAYVLHLVVLDEERHGDLVATEGIGVVVRVGRTRQFARVPRVLVVIEDVVAVHVVHRLDREHFLGCVYCTDEAVALLSRVVEVERRAG